MRKIYYVPNGKLTFQEKGTFSAKEVKDIITAMSRIYKPGLLSCVRMFLNNLENILFSNYAE